MKEQEVFCFAVDMKKEAQKNPEFDEDRLIAEAIYDRIAILNAQKKRVVDISFPKGDYADTLMVCLLYEEE